MIIKLKKYYIKILVFCVCLQVSKTIPTDINYVNSHPQNTCQFHIQALINNYKRKTTLLEICSDQNIISLDLAKQFPENIYILILLSNSTISLFNQINKHACKNIVVLEPKPLTYQDIETLSRCEHFDIVIAHEFYDYFENYWKNAVREILNLGDNIFILTDWKNCQKFGQFKEHKTRSVFKTQDGILALFQKSKTQLEIARFTQKYKPRNTNSPYKIISTFEEKLFHKNNEFTPWIHGINLMTFILLRGIYPTDDMISRKISNMKYCFSHHNDLMVGNMIIQGQNIIPIDFADDRRNASMTRCIRRALDIFNGDNSRLIDPNLTIKKYYQNSKSD